MKQTLPGPSEANIQASIIQYLTYLGFYVQRLNSGAMRDQRGHLIRLARAGTPDLMAFREIHEKILTTEKGSHSIERTRPQLVFIECKRPGNKPTILQSQVMAEMEEHGALCMVATSVEDVERQLAL